MKIDFGHHLSLTYQGGGEKWLTQLANELSLRGHEVSVYCLPFWKKTRTVQLLPEVSYHEGYFHKLKGDVAYITYNPLSWINFHTAAPKVGGIHSNCYWQPFALQYGLLANAANLVHMITKRWELKKFNAIHIVTPVYIIDAKNVYYIPNFVDSAVYHPTVDKNEEFTVCYCSRKVWQKGYDIYEAIKKELPDVKFIESNNTPENEMPDLYSQSHVTVAPARVDTFGLTIIESLFCGTPVICSGLPAHKALSVPLTYAHTVEEYVKEILEHKSSHTYHTYDFYTTQCRVSALKYDKPHTIDEIEQMLINISHEG